MDVIAPCELTRAKTFERVPARIIELTHNIAQDRIDALWWNYSELNIQAREGDQHWKWRAIVSSYSNDPLHQSVAVLSSEDYLEGALCYQFNKKSQLDKDENCVYVGWIATAPRNRKWICSRPFYSGVGNDLMQWALWESYTNNMGGRLALQSLPTAQTRKFYEAKGFIRTDMNQPITGLIDYELPLAAAQKWLQQSKKKGGNP